MEGMKKLSKNDISLKLSYKEALAVKHALVLLGSAYEDPLAMKLSDKVEEQIMQFRKDKKNWKTFLTCLMKKKLELLKQNVLLLILNILNVSTLTLKDVLIVMKN